MFFPQTLIHNVTQSKSLTPAYLCPCFPKQFAEKLYQLARDLLTIRSLDCDFYLRAEVRDSNPVILEAVKRHSKKRVWRGYWK